MNGISVDIGDALIALSDHAGNNVNGDWIIMETNRSQATEVAMGIAAIATQVQTDAGTDDTTIVTPLKLDTYLSNAGIQAYQADNGITINTGTTPDTIELGGALTKNTTIDAGPGTADFVITSSDGMGATGTISNGTSSVRIIADNANPGNGTVGNTELNTFVNGMQIIQSGTNGDGGSFTYNADYSANFVNRSIVDKEYVDTAITGVTITAGNWFNRYSWCI